MSSETGSHQPLALARPVFVQESGARARLVRRIGVAVAGCCLAYLAVVLSALTGLDLPSGPLALPRDASHREVAAAVRQIRPARVSGGVGEQAAGLSADVPVPAIARAERSATRGVVTDQSLLSSAVRTWGAGSATASLASSGASGEPSRSQSTQAASTQTPGTQSPGTQTPGTPTQGASAQSTGTHSTASASRSGGNGASRSSEVRPTSVPGSGPGTSHRPSNPPANGSR